MNMIRSPLRSTLRSPLRGALESKFGGVLNPLSISAPGSLTFLDSDQPISLYDFLAHNVLNSPEDFQSGWTAVGATIDSATVITDGGSGTNIVLQTLSITKDRQCEIYCRVAQDAIASGSGRFPCIQFTDGVENGYVVFDTSAADTNNGHVVQSGVVAPDDVSIVDVSGTHWDIKIRFTAAATTSLAYVQYYPALGQNVADLTLNGTLASYADVSATGSLTVTRNQHRDYSSPDVYTSTTTAAVASYGDIQFADTEDVGGDYTVNIAVTEGGTLTLGDPASGVTFGIGDGTADATMEFTGTIAEINDALLASSPTTLQGLASETATMTITMTRDADGATASTKSVNVTSYAALAISSTVPVDDTFDNAHDAGFVTATFSRNIQVGTGNVVLRVNTGSFADVETFDIAAGTGDAGGTIAVSGADLIITPNADLEQGIEYAVRIAATCIDGAEIGTGDSFAGITDDTTWSFHTRTRVTMVDQVILTNALTNRLIISSPGDASVEVYNGLTKLGDATLITAGNFEFSYTPAGVDYDVDFKTVGNVTGDGNEFNIVIAEANEIETDISAWTKSNASVTITGGQADPYGGTDAYLVETYTATNTAQYIEDVATATPSENDSGFEIWVKSNGHDILRVNPQEETAGHFAAIDLTSGEKFVDDAQIGVVETIGSWHRIWYRTINAAAPPETFRLYMCKALDDITPDSTAGEGMAFYAPRTADGILPMTAWQNFNFELTNTASGSYGSLETYEYTHPYIDTEADVNTTRYDIDVIKPATWSSSGTYKRVFALPALAKGTEDVAQDFITGVDDYANRYDVVIIIPYVKSSEPWFGEKDDGTSRQEDLLIEVVTQFSETELACSSAREDTFVIGYSKGGNAGYSLILRNPTIFGYACAWDGAFNAVYPNFGLGDNFGTLAFYNANYEVKALAAANASSVNDKRRLVLLGYTLYQADQLSMQTVLDNNSIDYLFHDRDTGDHSWGGDWLHNGMSELMLLGGVDADPYVVSLTPVDDATGIAVDATLDIRFDADVILVAGSSPILLRENDGGFSTIETFTRTSNTAATGSAGGTIAIADHIITITPGVNMGGFEHAVQIPANAVDDGQGNSFAGITDDTGWSFTVSASNPNTKLLLNFNGTDGQTTTTDSSASAHTVVMGADAQLDTAIKQYGSASLLLDGTGDHIRLDGSSEFAFGTGDFTVELWVYPNEVTGVKVVGDWRQNGAGANPLWYINGASMIWHDNGSLITATHGLSTGSWQHICMQRFDGTTRMFVDGSQIGSDLTDARSYGVNTDGPYFGSGSNGTSFNWNVQMDDLRIRKGEAVYGDVTSFTTPTSELTT